MTLQRLRFGQFGEALAGKALKAQGYRVLHTNYRTPVGEIDIIAKDGDTLVFVEVKTRKSSVYGSAKAAVTPAKQRKIAKNALFYLKSTRQMNVRARFDVVAINADSENTRVEIIKNAFEFVS